MGTDKRERKKVNRNLAREGRQKAQRNAVIKQRVIRFGIGIPLAILALWAVSKFFITTDSTSTTDTTVASSDTTIAVSDTTIASLTPTLSTTPGEQIEGDTKCPATDGTAVRTTNFTKAPPMCIDAKKSYMATFDTSEGTIEIALDTTKTPKTVNNFVTLSRYKYYDSSFIFRTDLSIDIIQGGGESNTDDPGYTIEDEGNGYKYTEGDIVMARTGAPNSAGGQFFIVTGPNASALDSQGTYVVFGKISKGLDVAKAILGLNAGSGQLGGAPSRAVKITSVTIAEK
ncbi:MAG: peptidylprolyl isomerase [Ilumatobacteraceae bacterium]|nr:peptidylprolyl isomerase [Ilumatobacteraceae bacterium]MBJ7486795.1 peptidylprolyl isomerase [Ilumatobacteraceae bacterium]